MTRVSHVRAQRTAVVILVIAAVSHVYREAALSYFFNDDFHWLAEARRFEPANLLRVEQYDHFYRPVIELYFVVGQQLFGCNALPFHVASIIVHLLNTLLLFLFARALTANEALALLAALFFCVQPSYVEAVTWIGAITDLLPALWYLSTLWLHLLFLQRRSVWFYVASLVTFVTCLLTHESSATLLPMMVLLEITVLPEGSVKQRMLTMARHAARYIPFALLLIGSLAIAYMVNSRSYLVREGHYAFGWHAVPNMLNYVVGLYVGKRILWSYVLIVAAAGMLLWKGSLQQRFYILLMFVSLAPASFFTWGTASRYLYVPAAAFALLLADLLVQVHRVATRQWGSRRTVRAAIMLAAAAVTVRFAIFAKKGADAFPELTRPYEQFAAEVRRSSQTTARGDIVPIEQQYVEDLPTIYVNPAAETALCSAGIRVEVR